MKTLLVIPARLASTRLPRKLLLCETGQPLLQHTYQAALNAAQAIGAEVLIAADSQEILQVAERFGGPAVLTDPQAASGSDRLAEVARNRPDVELLINLQGDEPELEPESVAILARRMKQPDAPQLATLATPIRDSGRLDNPNCVKLVRDRSGYALYFSRSLVPYPRDGHPDLATDPPAYLQHIGLYGYRREFLLQLPHLPVSPLEEIERLEQLRWLSAGYRIAVELTEHAAAGIDTAEDYAAFVQRYRASQLGDS